MKDRDVLEETHMKEKNLFSKMVMVNGFIVPIDALKGESDED